MRRFQRPQISVRTLVLLVTLICVYLGTWSLTQQFGVRSSQALLSDQELAGESIHAAITPPAEDSPGPFVVRRAVYGYMHGNYQYYVWLFGFRIKLPFERSMDRPN